MVTTSFVGCDDNMDNVLAEEDLVALRAMEAAYVNAELYNDSLISYVSQTGTTNDANCQFYDSAYHHHDSLFEVNHKRYSHNNSGDDHGPNDWHMGLGWMNGMGAMHGGNHGTGSHGFNTGNCTSENLTLMDSLMTCHRPYHTGN
jgi:hypothetical protein